VPSVVSMTVDDRQARAGFRRMGLASKDWRPPLRKFGEGYKLRVTRARNQMRVNESKQFRGEFMWPGHEPQYTRQTDGAVVPAWGGTQRIAPGHKKGSTRSNPQRMDRVTGKVQGKWRGSRKSGKGNVRRLKARDIQSYASGRMWGEWLGQRFDFKGKVELRFGKRLSGDVKTYAEAFHDKRKFAFFKLPQDQNDLNRQGRRHMAYLARKFGRR
jgi:hypothetical protein